MKILKRIITIIIWILLFVIISLNIYNFVSTKILKHEFTTINGYAMLKVDSGSMIPKIQVGDIIIIDTKPKTYKKNNIVTYRNNNSYITHRIVKVTKEGYITQGDANDTPDQGYVQDEQIVGVYKGKIGRLGILFTAFQNPFTAVMILIAGIIACILISIDKNGEPLDVSKIDKDIIQYKKKKKLKANIKEESKPRIKDTRVERLERKERSGELPTVEELLEQDKKKRIEKKKNEIEKTASLTKKGIPTKEVPKEKGKSVKGININEKKIQKTTKESTISKKKTINKKEGE